MWPNEHSVAGAQRPRLNEAHKNVRDNLRFKLSIPEVATYVYVCPEVDTIKKNLKLSHCVFWHWYQSLLDQGKA